MLLRRDLNVRDEAGVVQRAGRLLLAPVGVPHTGRHVLVVRVARQLVQHLLHLGGGEAGKQVLENGAKYQDSSRTWILDIAGSLMKQLI